MADNFLSQLDALDANIPSKNASIENNATDDFMSNLDALDANIPAKAQNKSSQADVRKFDKDKADNPKLNRFEQSILGITQGASQGIKDIASTALNYLPTGFISTISGTSPEVVEASRIDFKNALKKQEGEYQSMTPDTGFVPRTIGALADPIGATAVKLFPKATGIAKLGSNALGRALPNATLGALSTPEEDTLINRAKNAGLGVILGEGINAGGAGVRYLTGKAKGGASTENKAIQEALQKEGIRATAGDISDNNLLKKAEVLNENVPFGMSDYRKGQQSDINLSAENKSKALQDNLSNTDYEGLDNIVKATEPKIGASTYVVKPTAQTEANKSGLPFIKDRISKNNISDENLIGKEKSTSLKVPSQEIANKDYKLSDYQNNNNLGENYSFSKKSTEKTRQKQSPISGTIEEVVGAKTFDKRAREAEKVLENVYNAGDDPNRIIQASIQVKSLNNKIKADELYNDVEQAIVDTGNPNINVDNTLNKIKDILTSKNIVVDTKINSFLNGVKNSLRKQPKYSQLREFRTDLNDLIRQGTSNQEALVGNRAVNGYKQLLRSVEQDMKLFTKQNFKLDMLEQKADHFYKNNVVPYKNKNITNIINNEAPDTILNQIFNSKSEDKALNVINRLDEKGRQAIKYGLFQDALDKATNQTTGDKSPAKIAGYIEKYRKPINALGGDTPKEFRGYAKILRHVQRAGQFTEDPPTGNRAIGAGLLGGTLGSGNILLTAKILAGSQALKFLTTTKAGKALLLRASNLEQDSPMLDTVLKKITEALTKASIRQQTIPKADETNKDDELTPIDDDNLTTDDELQPIED